MRCLIVDEDLKHISRLRRFLEEEGFAVDCAFNGETGSYLCRVNTYDIVFFNHALPKKNSIQICVELRSRGLAVPILVFCSPNSLTERIENLSAGADDCIAKPYSQTELLARVRAILRRGNILREEIIEVGSLRLNATTQQVFVLNKPLVLSAKCYAILELLLRNRGRVVSRSTIVEHVWNMDTDPFSKTLETYIWKIRKDLGPKLKGLIRNVIGRGYTVDS